MTVIRKTSANDIPAIQEIANKTWPATYGAILSKEQVEFMMNMMYSDNSLLQQIQKQHQFFIVSEGIYDLGFVSIEHRFKNELITRIHKIYVLPETQGKGIGKLLLDKVVSLAKENDSNTISLNVNRFNKAYAFYKKIGFEIVGEENIAIGNGYLMEDFKMEMKI